MARVLALVAQAYGSGGGIAQFNRHLLEALLEIDDVDIRALSLLGDEVSPRPSALDWAVPAPGSKARFATSAAAAALRSRPHLIIAGLVGLAPLAATLALPLGSRLWTVTHGIEVWEPGGRFDNAALRRSHLVTTVSEYTRTRLREWSHIDGARVRILHNTIDLERFGPGPRPAELVERYGAAGKKVLLTVSRLAKVEGYKGHDRVIPLLRRLEQTVGPVHYVIAGRGDDQPRLEALVASCGVADLVSFAGFVPDEALEAHYRLADAFVMPSTGEGFGIVYLEAMACGCPVIAGNRDGSVDALDHGRLGRLVDPDDPRGLLSALSDTLRQGRSHDRSVPGVETFAIPRFRERVRQLVGDLLDAG